MNVEEAILELDIEQTIKELAIVCGYLQQEYKKQKELIDKIIKHCEEEIIAINCGHIETRSLRGQLKNILDLIKEYEDENK